VANDIHTQITAAAVAEAIRIERDRATKDLRDWFAGLAMQALVSGDAHRDEPITCEVDARVAYLMADAMLAARAAGREAE
jgi:hypothetical protein